MQTVLQKLRNWASVLAAILVFGLSLAVMAFFAVAALILVCSLVTGFTAFAFLNRRKTGGKPFEAHWVWNVQTNPSVVLQDLPERRLESVDVAAVQLFGPGGEPLGPTGQSA